MNEPLRCLNDLSHEAHLWDFGSGETFACDGWPDEYACTDECPADCEADHQGEE